MRTYLWLFASIVGLFGSASRVHSQVPTAHDPTPWGAATSARGPGGAEALLWAQLGHEATTQHLLTSMEVARRKQIEAADAGLAQGTYQPALDAPEPAENVATRLAAELKQRHTTFESFPALAAVWTHPTLPQLSQYFTARYAEYVREIAIQGRHSDLPTACAYLVDAEYRVLDRQHVQSTADERTAYRGTCIAVIARAEKTGALTDPATRGLLARTLAMIGAAYEERLEGALLRGDQQTQQQLQAFVAQDFVQTFGVPSQSLPPASFPCLLLDDPVHDCRQGLPVLRNLLNAVVARNP